MLKDVFVSSNAQRVLAFLAQEAAGPLFVREISERAGVSYGGASEALAELATLGLVGRETRGKTALYTANTRHPAVRQFKALLAVVASDVVPVAAVPPRRRARDELAPSSRLAEPRRQVLFVDWID